MKKGFTLIELIVVLGLLGVLIAGLIAAINPLEQINRGRVTTVKAQVAQLRDAGLSYNASKGTFPSSAANYVSDLQGTVDIKSAFTMDDNISITGDTTTGYTICGKMLSKLDQTTTANAKSDGSACTPSAGSPCTHYCAKTE